MIVQSEKLVVPLEIYTHSKRGRSAETVDTELRKRFFAVWNAMDDEEVEVEEKDAAD